MTTNMKIFTDSKKMFSWRIERNGEVQNIDVSEHGRATEEHEKELLLIHSRIIKNTTPEMVKIIQENSKEYICGDFKTRICSAEIMEKIFELATVQKEINKKIASEKEKQIIHDQKIFGYFGQVFES